MNVTIQKNSIKECLNKCSLLSPLSDAGEAFLYKIYVNPNNRYSAIAVIQSQLIKFSLEVYQQYQIKYCDMDLLILTRLMI